MLLLHTTTSYAAQLGMVNGSVVFGQPLDISIAARLDKSSEETADCFSADIYQANTRFDGNEVQIDVMQATNGLDAHVRIRSSTKIIEPWAKIVLSSNCGTKIAKSYEFITDFPSDVFVNSTLDTSTYPLTIKKQMRRPLNKTTHAEKLNVLTIDETRKSRLKVDPFELGVTTGEYAILLKLSNTLNTPSAGTKTPEEAQTFARSTAIWRSANGIRPSVDSVTSNSTGKNGNKLKIVDTMATASIKLANQKLEESIHFYKFIVYVLLGLLTFALGYITWLWLKTRNSVRIKEYSWLHNMNEVVQSIKAKQKPTHHISTTLGKIDSERTENIKFIYQNESNHAFIGSASDIFSNEHITLESNPLASLIFNSKKKKYKEQEINLNNDSMSPYGPPAIVWAINQSRAPKHINDHRFNANILQSQNKTESVITNTQPMTLEAIDFSMLDAAILSSSPVALEKPFHNSTQNDLINFESFSNPQSTDKC
jgi:hypothetical protein